MKNIVYNPKSNRERISTFILLNELIKDHKRTNLDVDNVNDVERHSENYPLIGISDCGSGVSKINMWVMNIKSPEVIVYDDFCQFIEEVLILLKLTRPLSIEVELNDACRAIISKDGVKINCQMFPLSIIDKLVKAEKQLQQVK